MVTATKKSDKPKKKSVKKGPKAPKAPVGRPRKNLGTRISDLPLVSTIKPAARRANVDSVALQRAKMQFKRDYPGLNVDEYQTRALLDVMQDPSRGAIGSRVLGPAEKTVLAQQIEEEKKAKELAKKLKKAKDKGKAIVTIDGNTYFDPKVLNRTLTTLPIAPLPVAPLPVAPLPVAPLPIAPLPIAPVPGPVAAKSRRINVRSAAKKVKIGKPPVGTPFKDTKEGKMAEARRSQVFDTKLPRMAREANEADDRGDIREADKIRAAAAKLAELAENRYTRDRATWEASQRAAPSTSARSPVSSRDLKKAKSIADKLVSPSNSEDSANAKALDAGTMFKESSPEVQAAVIQDLSQRVQDAPAGSDLAQVAIPEARSQLLVQTQRAFDELQQASDEELGRRLAEEEARQYGRFRPPTEQELAGQRAMEEIDIQQARPTKKQIEEYGKKIEQQLRAEQEEPVPVFRPRIQGPRDYLLEPFTPAEQAAADVVNKMAKARKASKAFQEQRSAATAIQALTRGRQTRKNLEEEALAREVAESRGFTKEAKDKLMEDARRSVLASELRKAASKIGFTPEVKARLLESIRNRPEIVASRDEAARRLIADQAVREMEEEEAAAKALTQKQYVKRQEAASKIQDAIRNQRIRQLYESARDLAREDEAADKAAMTLQALLRSKLTQSAMQKAVDQQEKEDAAIRVIQRAVRDKVEGVAKQKRIVSKIQDINTRIPLPRPPSAPGMTQPSIRYDMDTEDLIENIDLSKQLGAEDDAARKMQAALRRFVDRSRFAKAREIEAEYAAMDDDIVVPGTERFTPVPPESRVPSVRRTPSDAELAAAIAKGLKPTQGISSRELYATPREGGPSGLPPSVRSLPSAQDLESAIKRLNKTKQREEVESGPLDKLFAPAVVPSTVNSDMARMLQAKFAKARGDDDDEDFDGDGLIGGVLRRLRGMGYFDGYDSLTYNIHGTPDDNKKDLAAAKAAYAAKGGAMGGGSDWTLQAVTFPDKDWKTSSSLRWLRSNGIKPIKKADKQGTLFRYRITDPKGFTEYYTSDLMSRGRKIHLVYGK